MKNKALYLLLLLFATFSACEFDAVLQPKVYPQIETNEPVMDSSGVLFRATIKNIGSKPILKYGFAWSLHQNPTIENLSILMDGDTPKDSFSIKNMDGLTFDPFWVRAYVATEDYESYGKAVLFQSPFISQPVITDFSPKYGYAGDKIVIVGRNLFLSGKTTFVRMGDIPVHIDSCTSNRMVVTVPQTWEKGNYPISIYLYQQPVESKDTFEIRYSWTQKKNYQSGYNYSFVSFSSLNKGFAIYRASNTMRVYEPISDTWNWEYLPMNAGGLFVYTDQDTINPYSTAIETKLLAFSAGSKAYVFLSGVFWEYNTLTSAWVQKMAFPGVLEGDKKCVFGMFINGKLYLGNCGTNKSLWEYDPVLNSWSRKADFIDPHLSMNVHGNTSFAVQNKLYVGVTNSSAICKVYSYDPVGDVWTLKGNLPYQPYDFQASFVIDDVAYVGLGQTMNGDSWHLYKYDASGDTWSSCSLHPYLGNDLVNTSFVINGKAYLLMPDWSTGSQHYVWEYEPTRK